MTYPTTEHDLASMPALPADLAASRAMECGITLPAIFNWRTMNEDDRYFIAAVHDFSAPMLAEARITILAHRYRWTRARIMALSDWLMFDLGLRRVLAHIRPGDHIEVLAQRAVFRLTGEQTHDEAGRVVNVWVTVPEDMMLIGLKGVR